MSKLDNFFGRPMGIFNWVLSEDPKECAELAVKHGFSCIQWGYLTPVDKPEKLAKETIKIFEDNGLKVVALAGYQNLVPADSTTKEQSIKRLEEYIAFSHLFQDSKGIATETGTKNPESPWVSHPDNALDSTWKEMVEALSQLFKKAEAAGTRFLIEGYVEHITRTASDLEKLKQSIPDSDFGFIMDPFNLILEEQLPTLKEETEKIFSVMGERVEIAHAKDLVYNDGVVDTPRSGKGIFNHQHYFKLLDEKLPGVPLILEHLKKEEVGPTLDFLKSQYESSKTK